MSVDTDIDRFTKAPSLLLELCRDVIERLDAENEAETGETAAMEAQLRAVAQAIDKLDKQGIPIPDALRAEKTRLAAALGAATEATQTLNHFADELTGVLKELNERLGRETGIAAKQKKPAKKRSKSPKTDKDLLRKLILEALQALGGSAHKKDVLGYMEEKLKGQLLPGDLEWRDATNDYAWQNNACWERHTMKREGILKSGSPRGIWELDEDHR